MIQRFVSETNVAVKGELALKLGYVGTTNAVLVLAKELRSPLKVDEQQYFYSLRYRILQALGRAYPDEEMFNEELNFVTEGPNYGIQTDQERYLDRVEHWAEKEYGITWRNERPRGILRKQKLTPHPIRQ